MYRDLFAANKNSVNKHKHNFYCVTCIPGHSLVVYLCSHIISTKLNGGNEGIENVWKHKPVAWLYTTIKTEQNISSNNKTCTNIWTRNYLIRQFEIQINKCGKNNKKNFCWNAKSNCKLLVFNATNDNQTITQRNDTINSKIARKRDEK